MPAPRALNGLLVVAEVDVALGRRRFAAPAAFDLGAQREHVAKAGLVELRVPGEAEFRAYPAGTSFELAQKSGFDVKALAPAAYLCEFL